MKDTIYLLGNVTVYNALSLIISVVVPVVIMIFTIRHEKMMAEEGAIEQEEQFNKKMEQEKNNHRDTIKLMKENNRVLQLPFLYLNTDIKLEKRSGSHFFPLELVNVGNGVALDVSVVIKDAESDKLYYGPCVCINKNYDKEFLYRYADYMFTNALTVDSKTSFGIILALYENGVELSQEDPVIADKIEFSVKYKDAYYNEYVQNYTIYYSIEIGVGRVESGLPKPVKIV